MTEPAPLAIVRDPVELHRLLRARAEALDISREAIDELAGLPKGYAAKLLCEPPVKHLGPISFFPLAGALGFAIALVEDERRQGIIKRATKRKPGCPSDKNWRNKKALVLVQEWGRQGAQKMLSNRTNEELRELRSKAAKKRWRKHRRMLREMRRRTDLMRQVQLAKSP